LPRSLLRSHEVLKEFTMFSSIPQEVGAAPFPPLSPRPSLMRTVFDNGVEADLDALADRRPSLREDNELLAACVRALRDAPNVPKGCVVATVNNGTVVLDGRMSYFYERAAAECAVRFTDGVRHVENHIVVETPKLAHHIPKDVVSI